LPNTIWRDVDFEKQKIKVSQKKNSNAIWEWQVKARQVDFM